MSGQRLGCRTGQATESEARRKGEGPTQLIQWECGIGARIETASTKRLQALQKRRALELLGREREKRGVNKMTLEVVVLE